MSFILGMMTGGFVAATFMCILFASKDSNSRE